MDIPSPKTWTDRELVGPDDLNSEVRDPLQFLLNPPAFRLWRSAAHAAGTSAFDVVWDVVDFDTDAMWNAAAPTDIVVSTPGYYLVSANLVYQSNATGWRHMAIEKNAANISYQVVGAASGISTSCSATVLDFFDVGDVISLSGVSSVALNLEVGGRWITQISGHWVRPL